jgi:uncharacterized protein DUF362
MGPETMIVESPLGRRPVDRDGAPVAVVRVDPRRSYADVGRLLQRYLNDSDQAAWAEIKARIDYTYETMDLALAPLASVTRLRDELAARVREGRKLLFKPNLVRPIVIDFQTRGPDRGSTACTEWAFMAALMRWFHDKLGIRYHQMSVGEAGTAIPALAAQYTALHAGQRRVTPEAVIEGRSGDFYGGWGFYFARKYLAETRGDPGDDPMAGHAESVAGTYIPPGHVHDRLMVYDLNRIFDDPTKGRRVAVPDGVNFASITLHKVVVGGTPGDAADREAYPGCVLINVPKLKVHSIALFTNVIKNLGIGLYPMQSSESAQPKWEYSIPHGVTPGVKAGIPHQVWVSDIDHATGLPRRDRNGAYVVEKTGGINATMVDIIQAVKSQGIFMVHVVDAIEAINLDHTGNLPGTKEPEGLVFAGLDPVAMDLLGARYMFSNVPLGDAVSSGVEDGHGGHFPQRVPLPAVKGNAIVTETGYDCPLARDTSLRTAEERGLGARRYHVLGWDTVANSALVSLDGHLGTARDGTFVDLVTGTLYFDAYKMAWDLQRTAFGYLEAVDRLAGSSLKKQFLESFDEDADGVVTYDEFGKTGVLGTLLHLGGDAQSRAGTEPFGYLSGPFRAATTMLRCTEASWNRGGHDLLRDYFCSRALMAAYRMSQVDAESPDPRLPGLVWGKGKWPSWEFAWHVYVGATLYGPRFPHTIGFPGMYALAFRYADLIQTGGRYAGDVRTQPSPGALDRYVAAVLKEHEPPLDFTVYVPSGYESVGGRPVPNVRAATDPAQVWTASFMSGRETWGVAV